MDEDAFFRYLAILEKTQNAEQLLPADRKILLAEIDDHFRYAGEAEALMAALDERFEDWHSDLAETADLQRMARYSEAFHEQLKHRRIAKMKSDFVDGLSASESLLGEALDNYRRFKYSQDKHLRLHYVLSAVESIQRGHHHLESLVSDLVKEMDSISKGD